MKRIVIAFVLFTLAISTLKAQTISTDIRVDSAYATIKYITINELEETPIIVGNGLISQPALASDLDIPGYDLLNASFFYKEDVANQKVVFAPFKLVKNTNPNNTIFFNWYTNLKFNGNYNKDQVTLGLSLFSFDNSIHNSKRSKRMLSKLFSNTQITETMKNPPSKWKDEKDSTKQWTAYYKATNAFYDSIYDIYNAKRTKHIFRTSAAYNIQLFPVLASRDTAKISDFDSLNYFTVKSHVFSPSLSYSHKNGKFNMSLTYNFFFSRASAVKMQEMVPYQGVGGNISFRIAKFMKWKDLRKKDFYKKSLYIPGVNLGVAVENKACVGDLRFAEKAAKNQLAITPFIDFNVSPTNQFRLGVTYSNNTTVNKKTFQVAGALLQYNFKLSTL